jgi:putative hemolysin
MVVSIVILSVLILLSGSFSSMEIAVSSANRTKIKTLAESGDKKANLLLKAIKDPTSFFATTQLYITFIAFFSGAYAADSFSDPLVAWALGLGLPLPESVAGPIMFILVTIILTYFMLVFGALIPKRLALRNSMTISLGGIGVLNILSKIVLPFVKLLAFSANLLLRIFGVKGSDLSDVVTKEEIQMILKSGTNFGSIAETEHDIMSNVLKLEHKTAGDICVHRLDVIALPVDSSFDEIVQTFAKEQYSRLPIFEESIDNIVGFLHIKDILKYMVDFPDRSNFDIKKLLYEPYFVPSSRKTEELLREMQENHVYLAFVIDEYGGMTGVISTEILVEEIVGSIFDEHDDEEPPEIAPCDDGKFAVQGFTELTTVQDHFKVDLPVDEFNTLNGFLISLLQRIPAEDEQPELEYNGLLFKVESVQEKCIANVTVSVVDYDSTENSES